MWNAHISQKCIHTAKNFTASGKNFNENIHNGWGSVSPGVFRKKKQNKKTVILFYLRIFEDSMKFYRMWRKSILKLNPNLV